MAINVIGGAAGSYLTPTISQSSGGSGKEAASGSAEPTAAGGSSSSAKTYDPKDTNKDGIVSLQEELAWALKHPGDAGSADKIKELLGKTQTGALYDQQGNQNTNVNSLQNLLNLRV
jgi:hypothetical protein